VKKKYVFGEVEIRRSEIHGEYAAKNAGIIDVDRRTDSLSKYRERKRFHKNEKAKTSGDDARLRTCRWGVISLLSAGEGGNGTKCGRDTIMDAGTNENDGYVGREISNIRKLLLSDRLPSNVRPVEFEIHAHAPVFLERDRKFVPKKRVVGNGPVWWPCHG